MDSLVYSPRKFDAAPADKQCCKTEETQEKAAENYREAIVLLSLIALMCVCESTLSDHTYTYS